MDQITDDDGTLTELGEGLEHIDTFFTIIFTVELAINAYAHWFRSFALDGWNMFDSIVVSLSLVALGPIAMPISVLRSVGSGGETETETRQRQDRDRESVRQTDR